MDLWNALRMKIWPHLLADVMMGQLMWNALISLYYESMIVMFLGGENLRLNLSLIF